MAEGGELTLDCSGDGSCLSALIDASFGGQLDIKCYGEYAYSCTSLNVLCPAHHPCNIECNGGSACSQATIEGSVGTQLLINASGSKSFERAEVSCPPDTIPGDDYLEDGLCHISVTGNSAMQLTKIKIMDGWNALQLICQNPPCDSYTNFGSGPQLFCGANLANFC